MTTQYLADPNGFSLATPKGTTDRDRVSVRVIERERERST